MRMYGQGHLVIASLVSNAYNTAGHNKIIFKAEIKIDKDRITIERYDLSIVLGNLLDNAIGGVCKDVPFENRFINVGIFTSENALVFDIVNSAVYNGQSDILKSDKPDKVRHGYGLNDIRMIAENIGQLYCGAQRLELWGFSSSSDWQLTVYGDKTCWNKSSRFQTKYAENPS